MFLCRSATNAMEGISRNIFLQFWSARKDDCIMANDFTCKYLAQATKLSRTLIDLDQKQWLFQHIPYGVKVEGNHDCRSTANKDEGKYFV
jgi:hypothetical protein